MFYGNAVEINNDGIRIDPSALLPLGIGHQSRCWGMWLEKGARPVPTEAADHLILSPIPPDSWPACFRLQVLLRHSTGSLSEAAELLASTGVNVISTDVAPAGFAHGAWNAFCESLSIKGWATRLYHRLRADSKGPFNYEEFTLRVALRQFLHINFTQWFLRAHGARSEAPLPRRAYPDEACDEDLGMLFHTISALQNEIDQRTEVDPDALRVGYLDRRFVYGQGLLLNWTEETIRAAADDEDIRRDIERFGDLVPALCDRTGTLRSDRFSGQGPDWSAASTPERISKLAEMMRLDFLHRASRAVEANMCPTLLGTWAKRDPSDPIYEFEYSEEDRILRLGPSSSRTFQEHPGLNPPLKATASFSLRDGFIRIIPLQESYRRARFRANVDYRLDYARAMPAPRSTAGLLSRVAGLLCEQGANILRLEHRLTECEPADRDFRSRECGRFGITGLAAGVQSAEDMNSFMAALRNSLEGLDIEKSHASTWKVEACVERDTVDRIYISTRFSTEFWDQHRSSVESTCRRFGFQPVVVEERDQPITESVVQAVRAASAFLQIIPLDGGEKIESIDLTWLVAEHAMARALEIPLQRAFQRRFREDADAKALWMRTLKLDGGRYIDDWWGAQLLERTLPAQLGHLRDRVDGVKK